MIVTFPSVKKKKGEKKKEKKKKGKGKKRRGEKKDTPSAPYRASSPDPVAFEIARDRARRQGQAEILHFS
jgi:hypothetical protein